MAKIGKYIHRAEWEGTQVITTSYLAGGAGQELIVNQSSGYGEGLVGKLSHLLLNFTNGATLDRDWETISSCPAPPVR